MCYRVVSGHTGAVTSPSGYRAQRPVPTRTILATIGLLLATALLLYIVVEIRQVLTWIIVGAFFAVALSPVVGWVQRRLFGGRRRSLATLLGFRCPLVLPPCVITAFARPPAQ